MVTTHELVGKETKPEMEEEMTFSNPSSPRARNDDLVGDIISIIESLKKTGEYRKTQRKECHNLIRKLNILLPILEEIRDIDRTIPDAGIECFKKLKRSFQSAKKLLKMCHSTSKIFLALESEAMMVRFHTVYEKISKALEEMPYEELGIMEEEKEQIELLLLQLKRARKRTDTQDMELTMDLMVALSTNDDGNTERASMERLVNKLDLHTAEELKIETLAVQKVVKERRGCNSESTQQVVNLLNKFKQLAGIEEDDNGEDPQVSSNSPVKTTAISIPHEFLCPITLEIMTDPVIVATGQTYERESIRQWLDSNHRTCPKTGQDLTHLSLAPNFALKNIIDQWCEKNNFQLPKKELPECAESTSSTTDDEKILNFVRNLSSSRLDEQRKAVKKIRLLSKESPENRILIANSGGIPPLVKLLSYPDSKIQEHAVTALLNLSIDESNKKLVSRRDPIPAIIEILQKGTTGAKENSAAALFSLSMLDDNKVKIGSLNGIPPLVELLRHGTIRGKKDAVTALFNLCLNHSNKISAIESGIVAPLLKVLEDKKLEMVNETLSLLLILAGDSEGRQQLGQLPFVKTLVNLITEGGPKTKECATAVLLELGSHNSNLILVAMQYGAHDQIVEVSKNGTERGQRKANSLLRLMGMVTSSTKKTAKRLTHS